MLVKALASSSAGNCYLISDGSSSLLLECGIPLKDIRRKGVDLLGLSGCLISHEHGNSHDVVKYAHIYASAGTLQHGLGRTVIARRPSPEAVPGRLL